MLFSSLLAVLTKTAAEGYTQEALYFAQTTGKGPCVKTNHTRLHHVNVIVGHKVRIQGKSVGTYIGMVKADWRADGLTMDCMMR
jgi:hypothetical protein